MLRKITILGSTGSIGRNTLAVVKLHPERFAVHALTAHTDIEGLFVQCQAYKPDFAAMADPASAKQLAAKLKAAGLATTVLESPEALSQLASDEPVDVVVGAIVGAIGLLPTLAAVRAGKTVLIANKEPLVMLGREILQEAVDHGATILPVDSEHNAIFQCMPDGGRNGVDACGIEKILLTGSGGPFRALSAQKFSTITPAQACAHPNWKMGQKISVDSASMMNKGLELVEACALFDVAPQFVEIVVHPQSVIHSMVQYVDGTIIAQMGAPDMRTPIAHALGWPERIESGSARLDLAEIARFDFEPPDERKFPALRLARESAEHGGTLPTVLNAANEVAVDAFLKTRIRFDQIPEVIERSMQALVNEEERSLESVLHVDQRSREFAESIVAR